MDDEIPRAAVVAAVASSPRTLTMQDAVEILERQAAFRRPPRGEVDGA